MSRLTALTTTALAVLAAAVPAGAAAHTRTAAAHAAASCGGADTSAAGARVATMRVAVLCLVNQQRAIHRLPALRESRQLDQSAQGWTDTMVRTAQFTRGTNFWNRITAVGYRWSNVGENIASGFLTPRQVVDGWMASLGHCQNILGASFADLGTGVNTAPLGGYGPATWTQDFGLSMGQAAPSSNTGPARGCPYRVS